MGIVHTLAKPKVGLLVALLAFASLPIFLSGYRLHVATYGLLLIFLTQAWNIVGGIGGHFSFANALFIGTGAYTSTLLYLRLGISPWLGMLVGALLSAFLGVFIMWLSHRSGLPNLSFCLVSLGFTYMGTIVAESLELLGGSSGLVIPLKPGFVNFQWADRTGYYYVALAFVVGIMFFCYWLLKSKLGLYMMAVRDNEAAAQGIGVDIAACKIIAIGISASLCSFGGTFYAQWICSIQPHSAINIPLQIEMIMFCFIGGSGTLWGPVLGAGLMAPIGQLFSTSLPGVHLIFYGVVVVVIIIVMPKGIIPSLSSVYSRATPAAPTQCSDDPHERESRRCRELKGDELWKRK